MRVCSAGHVRPLLVEKARGRMQELQSSKRLTISRLSGRRSYRHLSTSWQTSRRPSAGRPLSCIRFCLGAESATWLSVRLRCVKSHTGSRSLYACVSFTPPPRGLGHAAPVKPYGYTRSYTRNTARSRPTDRPAQGLRPYADTLGLAIHAEHAPPEPRAQNAKKRGVGWLARRPQATCTWRTERPTVSRFLCTLR